LSRSGPACQLVTRVMDPNKFNNLVFLKLYVLSNYMITKICDRSKTTNFFLIITMDKNKKKSCSYYKKIFINLFKNKVNNKQSLINVKYFLN
jgi:hypothetical protein